MDINKEEQNQGLELVDLLCVNCAIEGRFCNNCVLIQISDTE